MNWASGNREPNFAELRPFPSEDCSEALRERVLAAYADRTPLFVRGSGSRLTVPDAALSVAAHAGITYYEPSEMAITARAGTLLRTVEATLAEHGQLLGFEPPRWGESGTLGGAMATGWSGSRRPYGGSARDLTLGCTVLSGTGEVLRFGGRVMKNVAGFDVSRLMVGAFGTLGILLDVTLKVLPKPTIEKTVAVPAAEPQDALERMRVLRRTNVQISALAWVDGVVYVRLAGPERAMDAAQFPLKPELVSDSEWRWEDLRDQQLPWFASASAPLWRLSLGASAPHLGLDGQWLFDWGGSLRWLQSPAPAELVHAAVESVGGHAQLFLDSQGVRQVPRPRLSGAQHELSRRLKQVFDPAGILNPGWMV